MIELDPNSYIEQLKSQRNNALDDVAALTALVIKLKAQLPAELEVVKKPDAAQS